MQRSASNLLFLSEASKAVQTYSPWEVHTKSLSCDQMNTGGRWASWCILATWSQELVSVSYGFRKVHTGPCGRTGLKTPTWSICQAVRPVWGPWDSLRGSARLSRVFYSRWESLTFGQGPRAIPYGSKIVQNIVSVCTACLAITHGFCAWFSCDRSILTATTRLMPPSNSRKGGGTSLDATVSIGPSLCSVTSNGMLV